LPCQFREQQPKLDEQLAHRNRRLIDLPHERARKRVRVACIGPQDGEVAEFGAAEHGPPGGAQQKRGRSRASGADPIRAHPVDRRRVLLRVLSGIARTGSRTDRLRAAELLGKHLGMLSVRQVQGVRAVIDKEHAILLMIDRDAE